MTTTDPTVVPVGDAREAGLRAGLFRLGGLLGLDTDEVVAFGEAVVSKPWQHCGSAELEQILREFREVAATIRALQARRRGARPRRGGRRGRGW